jgi:hypothetical protein
MEPMSFAEAVLFGIADESGVVPEGGLLERLEGSSPGARRRLARLDGEVAEWCAVAPLEIAHLLTGMLEERVGDDLRIDHDRAWEVVVAARRGGATEDPDATVARLLDLAHAALGLPTGCAACTEWEPPATEAADDDGDPHAEDGEDGGEDHEDHDHDHHHGHGDAVPSLVERVFTVHADALDTWEAQVASRIAADAGEDMAEIAGFEVLHGVVGHAGRAPGLSRERHAEIHAVQHVGLNLCIDIGQVQGLRAAVRAMADGEGVASRLSAAETAAAEEAGVLAAVAASVVVDRLAGPIAAVLDQAPPPSLPTRPAGKKRRRR